MNTGVLWEDIQVGKLYTPFISFAIVGYLKLYHYGDIKAGSEGNNVGFLLEAGKPIMILSRYYEQDLKRGWLRILKEDKAYWIRYENSFVAIANGD